MEYVATAFMALGFVFLAFSVASLFTPKIQLMLKSETRGRAFLRCAFAGVLCLFAAISMFGAAAR